MPPSYSDISSAVNGCKQHCCLPRSSSTNTIRRMAKRRELTDEEACWAENLSRIWLEKKDQLGLTQLSAALELGYKTQSAFSQYVNGVIPLNTDAKAAIAKLLRVDVTEIDPSFYSSHPMGAAGDAAELRDVFARLSPAARAQVIGFAKGLAMGLPATAIAAPTPISPTASPTALPQAEKGPSMDQLHATQAIFENAEEIIEAKGKTLGVIREPKRPKDAGEKAQKREQATPK